jgi:hypothetical protein
VQAQLTHLEVTLTNPANGKFVTSQVAEHLQVQAVEDGTSALAVFTGLGFQVTVPGQGHIFTQAGRIIFELPCPDISQCRLANVVFLLASMMRTSRQSARF